MGCQLLLGNSLQKSVINDDLFKQKKKKKKKKLQVTILSKNNFQFSIFV